MDSSSFMNQMKENFWNLRKNIIHILRKTTLFNVILQIPKINPYFTPWEFFFLKELHLFYALVRRISRTFFTMQSEIVSYVLNIYSQVELPDFFSLFLFMQGKRIIFFLIFHAMNIMKITFFRNIARLIK